VAMQAIAEEDPMTNGPTSTTYGEAPVFNGPFVD
jgi:hypothetical protein